MKTTNQHPNAGAVHRISGLTFTDGLAGKSTIYLYRAGSEIHQLCGGLPIGPVAIKPYDEAVAGWGMTGPFVEIASSEGGSIVVEKKDLPA